MPFQRPSTVWMLRLLSTKPAEICYMSVPLHIQWRQAYRTSRNLNLIICIDFYMFNKVCALRVDICRLLKRIFLWFYVRGVLKYRMYLRKFRFVNDEIFLHIRIEMTSIVTCYLIKIHSWMQLHTVEWIRQKTFMIKHLSRYLW